MNTRVNIYRNTTLYDGRHYPSSEDVGPKWEDIVKRLQGVFDHHMDNPNTQALEPMGLDLLWPYLRKRKGKMPSLKDRPHACWTYDDTADGINIHIANLY